MREFTNRFLENTQRYLYNDICRMPSLCALKGLNFSAYERLPDYGIPAIQRLYLLRYAYAYLAEYYYMYGYLMERFGGNRWNVLSIGAGCGLDYYGAYFSVGTRLESLNYIGIDRINWLDQQQLGKFRIHINEIENVDFNIYADANVIIFPKSICELSETSYGRFSTAIQNRTFNGNRILLVSSQRSTYIDNDHRRFYMLVDQFAGSGYTPRQFPVVRAPEGSRYFYDVVGFCIPDGIRCFLENLADRCPNIDNCPCGNGRGQCDTRNQLNRAPMYSTNYMNFEYAVLER